MIKKIMGYKVELNIMRIYSFDDLSESVKEEVVERMADINVFYEWWEYLYGDAENVKLKLTEFDIGRGSYCKGNFIEYASDTVQAIIENHGEDCETFKTAEVFVADSMAITEKFSVDYNEDGFDNNERERERDDEQADLDDEFLKNILEDYRIILQKEYEYMTSEKAIVETIRANEYDFTEDGNTV